jgi:tetratricopeptide (TPR) repeat protein
MVNTKSILRASVFGLVILNCDPASAAWYFDYWSRCSDLKIEPERRIGYCKSMLGRGRGDDYKALTEIGTAYIELHKFDAAIEVLQSAVAVDDCRSSSRYGCDWTGNMLSEARVLGGQYARAMANADNKVDQDQALPVPEPEPFQERCWLRAIAGRDLDVALTDCNKALKMRSGDAPALESRGLVEFKLGRLKDAAADFDTALVIQPKLQTSLFMRGIIKLHNGDSAGGKGDIEAAKEREPLIADTFALYGVTF